MYMDRTCKTWSFAGSTPALSRAAGRHETAEPCPPFGFTKRVCNQASDTTSKNAFASVTYSSTRRVCSRGARQGKSVTGLHIYINVDGRRARTGRFVGLGGGRRVEGREEGGFGDENRISYFRVRINGKTSTPTRKVDRCCGGARLL